MKKASFESEVYLRPRWSSTLAVTQRAGEKNTFFLPIIIPPASPFLPDTITTTFFNLKPVL